MSWLARTAHATFARILRNRDRLPAFANRLIDDVAKNPDGLAGRFASTLLGGRSKSQIPAPTVPPQTSVRVYIGPTNYSGQGHRWAQALMNADPVVGARNMAVELPGGFAFEADSLVPVAVYNSSSAWQRAELEAVRSYTHALIEAERPLFGNLFDRDVSREVADLRDHGVSVAFLSHGTDLRSPRAHRELTEWSPFGDDSDQTAMLQRDADQNLSLLENAGRPVFVSTPDLLLDLPTAIWCPVVIDPGRWRVGRPILSDQSVVVAHAPSMSSIKGTHLIQAAVGVLAEDERIEYRTLSGVRASAMPAIVGDADIVLDQFRIGSYGVAAVEAMAAGRVVVGHVLPVVRQLVFDETGLDLPVVDATPDTLARVVIELLEDPERMRRLGNEGVLFVDAVHSGTLSASVLREHWIDST